MGVRGLKTFIKSKDGLFSDYKLCDTKLIIDGSNLIYSLYEFYDIPYQFGGDYDHFARKCREFFCILDTFGVKPIVVFDGANDPNDMKLKTHSNRLNKQYGKVKNIFKQFTRDDEIQDPNESDTFVLPLLSKITFHQVLLELGIVHVACLFEADVEIAVLANHFKCPVLSDDSDFYVFDLEVGYIPLYCLYKSLQTKQSTSFLCVKIYNCNRLLEEEFSLKADRYKFILPIFASLKGNDYIDLSGVELTTGTYYTLSCGRRCELQQIINWICKAESECRVKVHKSISNKMPEDISKQMSDEISKEMSVAISVQMFSDISEQMSTTMKEQFQHSVSSYTKIQSNENNSFMIDLRKENLSDEVEEIIQSRFKKPRDVNGNEFPLWFVQKLVNCDVDCSFLLNIAVNRRIMFRPQLEKLEKPSSFACSKGIRRIVYGIMMGSAERHKSGRSTKIKEYHRRSTHWSNVASIKGFSELPSIFDNGSSLPERDTQSLLLSAFGDMAQSFRQDVEKTSILMILMLSLWKGNSCATDSHVRAVIICIIAMHTKPGGKYLCQDIIEACTAMGHDKTDDFKKRMEKHQDLRDIPDNKDTYMDILHKMAQLQAIFQHTYFLNQLLGSPFSIPNVDNMLNGTFIYNIYTLLVGYKQPEEILDGRTSVLGGEKSALFSLFVDWERAIDLLQKKCVRKRCPIASTKFKYVRNPSNRFEIVLRKINNAI